MFYHASCSDGLLFKYCTQVLFCFCYFNGIRLKFSTSANSCEHLLNSESHNFGSGVAELTSHDPEAWWTKVNIV